MKKVLCLLENGFEEIEAISVIDILRRAEIEIDIVSDYEHVEGLHGVKIFSDKPLSKIDYKSYDLVFLPGGGAGTENLFQNTKVREIVNYFYENNKYIAAICAAPSILGRYGLLHDKKVTCYPAKEFINQLDCREYIDNQAVVVDGKIITSRGPATAPFLALKIIEILVDRSLSATLKDGLLYSSLK